MLMQKSKRSPLVSLLEKKYPDYSRDQLVAYIVCKNVLVDGQTYTDPRVLVNDSSNIELSFPKYVSRGGSKLEYALDYWKIDPTGLVFVDAGSSTGGFTDCLLQRGALKVHSVDVGYNQLDYRLRTDERVVVHEKQNIMTVTELDPVPQAAVADLSFRSIRGAASHILDLTTEKWLISLIKPQFEVPRWKEGFFGVVEDPALLIQVMTDVYEALVIEGVGIQAIITSPILGRKGNTEFLALLKPIEGMSLTVFKQELHGLIATADHWEKVQAKIPQQE
jgi:23S rRNA (cytidine1920-2'-O)/16S rRNA (cytidine1409-2'-O)-methyltransferase